MISPRFLFLCGGLLGCLQSGLAQEKHYAELRVIDRETKRGVPLVELITVDEQRFVTDNAGRIAFHEPDLMGKEIYFSVKGQGYEASKDGFGFQGVRVTPKAGAVIEIPVTRTIVAERLARLTGQGRWRDTQLLGHPVPLADSANPGMVAGQDSVQAAIYRGNVYWFWGDTNQMKYPLGLYRTAGATTPIPTGDCNNGFAYDYFTDKNGFARAMMPLPERHEGVVWMFGVCTVTDGDHGEKLISHYSRRKGLVNELEQGIAVFDDEKKIFTVAKQLPKEETWRFPKGSPMTFEEQGKRYLMFGSPIPNVRVPATLSAVLDPTQYEAHVGTIQENGQVTWKWQKELPPTDGKQEAEWLKAKKIKPEQARYHPIEVNGTDPIELHSGSVRWNEFRKQWIVIAGRIGGKASFLGEVWYSESDHPTGPFSKAVLIAKHDKQTFYNVNHHEFLNRDAGRTVYFEGTYTNEFSGNPEKTAKYNYNQLLYRLDVNSAALKKVRAKN